MTRKYVKRPIVIEALQWTGDNKTEMLKFCSDCYCFIPINSIKEELHIKTLEGVMVASLNDYIIKGVKGEFYPCRKDIFLETYKEVTNE